MDKPKRHHNKNGKLWAADGPGFSSKTDDWATPQAVFDALDAEFGFDLDVCASDENHKCERYYTVADDGLAQEWTGTAFCNPPYGRGENGVGPWVEKACQAADAGVTVVCLVPARTDNAWWHDSVMRAAEVRLVRRRLKFGDGNGSAPFPSAIVVFRPGHDGPPSFSAVDARELEEAGTRVAARRQGVTSPCASGKGKAQPAPAAASAPRQPAKPLPLAAVGANRAVALRALAKAVAKSGNKKIGKAATTYVAQTSCPPSCAFFDGGGCYAEQGRTGLITRNLNQGAEAVEHTPLDAAWAEAAAIEEMKVIPGNPLRLHTVGDCASDEAARIVSGAAARYRQRGGGPVWSYTHAWRQVSRESWGEVSVLASCETKEDTVLAQARGYAAAIVVEQFTKTGRHALEPDEGTAAQVGVDVMPCPEQTGGKNGKKDITCDKCKLCFNDTRIYKEGYSIAFELHGEPLTIRKATKALRTPDDPDRRLTTRDLIPRVVAEMRAKGELDKDGAVSGAELARRLSCNDSSIGEMRKRLALEALRREPTPSDGAIAKRLGLTAIKVAEFRRQL